MSCVVIWTTSWSLKRNPDENTNSKRCDMADLDETDDSGSQCPPTDLDSYNAISETFCSDDVNAFVIENVVETFSSSDMAEASFIDSHQLIVDSVLEHGSHLVASSDGQFFRLYKDGGDLTMTSTTTTVNGQPAIILRGLPYSQELLQTVKTEDDGCGPSRSSSKRMRVESDADKGYDVILSVSANAKFVSDLNGGVGNASLGSQNIIDEDSNESAMSKVEESLTNPSDVSQNWFTTKDDKLALQSKGHQWKQGQWTKQEVDTLRQNIAQYCEERGIDNPADVIFNMTKDERKNFYRTIAKGLQRPLFSVYRRVIRMYDRKNYIGKYSPEELARLKELRKKHGSDWATIGNILGRSASSVKDRCRLMKDTCNTGKWYPEEEKRLSDVVYQLSGAKPGESVTSGLSWAQVAEHVNSRSEKQCRTKWLNYLNWKVKGGAEWTRDDDLLLLERLSEVQAKEEVDINWITIAADWPSARSPQWLHGKWWSMKRHITNYSQMPFPQLLQMVKSMHTRNKTRSPTVSSFASVSSSVSSCLPSALHSSNSIKLEDLDFQTLQVMPGGKLAIPVTMTIDGGASMSVGVGDDDEEESRTGSSVQSYRFLEDVCETGDQETYVIAGDSETNPSSTVFTMNGILADSLVIHTLKQVGGQTNKNVLVQMNPGINQVIIARDIHDDSDDSAHVLSSHHPVFHQLDDVGSSVCDDTDKLGHHRILHVEELEEEEVMNSMSVVINGDDLDVGEHISCDDELVIANNFCEVIESEIHEQIDVGHSLDSELVSLSGPHYVRMESNDGGNVLSSFADPMLMTDSSDLLSSMSDGDGDKSQEAIDQSSDH